MSFTDDQVKIAQKAQSAATLDPMSSFADPDSLPATVASELYEVEVQSLLVQEPWGVAKAQVVLNRLTDTPTGRWTAAYQIPSSVGDSAILAVRAVTVNDSPIRFDRYGDKVYCDAGVSDEVLLDYMYRCPEDLWPPDFRMFVIYTLGALFATAITRNADVVAGLQGLADIKFNAARRNYSQGVTAKKLGTKRFVNKRR